MAEKFDLLNTDLNIDEEYCNPSKKMDFIYEFFVLDGNPNGDPDTFGMPRQDAIDEHGLVSDVSLKRKIRNFVQQFHPELSIFVQEEAVLGKLIDAAGGATDKAKTKQKLAELYWDVRIFGGVLAGNKQNAGQIIGPVQINIGRSLEPINILEMGITRCAATNEKEGKENKTMGRKFFVGGKATYRLTGHYSAKLAEKWGVSRQDLDVFWGATKWCLENSHSAARGLMGVTRLEVWVHNSSWGDAPAHKLFFE